MEINNIFESNWLNVLKFSDENSNEYIYASNKSESGYSVAILPFKLNENNEIEFFLRKEFRPNWSTNELIQTCITGRFDKETLDDVAVEEMKEEAGYTINKDELYNFGECFESKITNSKFKLYGVNLTNKQQEEDIGDGSEFEKMAENFWIKNIENINDPLVHILHNRFLSYFK